MAVFLNAACLTSRAQTQAQPELPITKISIGGKSIRAEIADEEHERAAGLMFRKELADDARFFLSEGRHIRIRFTKKDGTERGGGRLATLGPSGSGAEIYQC